MKEKWRLKWLDEVNDHRHLYFESLTLTLPPLIDFNSARKIFKI